MTIGLLIKDLLINIFIDNKEQKYRLNSYLYNIVKIYLNDLNQVV